MEEHNSITKRPKLKFSGTSHKIKDAIDTYDTCSNENGVIVNRHYLSNPEIKNSRISQQRLLKINDIFLDIEDRFYDEQGFSKIINISEEEFNNIDNILIEEEDDMYVETVSESCVNDNITYYFKIISKYKKNQKKPNCKIGFLELSIYK
tara:strand:- start:1052 stop:1501 length:450 start_codon:yes stop_codon:yes gene_type:complete